MSIGHATLVMTPDVWGESLTVGVFSGFHAWSNICAAWSSKADISCTVLHIDDVFFFSSNGRGQGLRRPSFVIGP